MQVFLSYARSDATREVDQLQAHLRDARQMGWVDRDKLEGGVNWWDKVSEAITNCGAFVLLITPESMKSPQVADEFQLALALHKPFFPILVLPSNLPLQLQRLNYRDLTQGNYTNGLSKLMGDLASAPQIGQKALADLLVEPPGAQNWTPVRREFESLVKELIGFAQLGLQPSEVFVAFSEVLAGMSASPRPLYDLIDEFLNPAQPPHQNDWPNNVIAAHRSFFDRMLKDVRQQLGPAQQGEPIPIVLVIMTRAEADELQNGSALAAAPIELLQQFASLKGNVPEKVPGDWVTRYGASPELWTPYDGCADVGQMVRDELARISAAGTPVYPKFIDIRTLNATATRAQLKQLRYEGCVVIMDLLSICHPKLHEAYLRSMLFAQERVVLVQMSPFGSFPQLADVNLTFRKRLDLEFWDRFKLDRDTNCKRISDEVDFQRFVSADLVNVLPVAKRPGTGVHSFIKQRE